MKKTLILLVGLILLLGMAIPVVAQPPFIIEDSGAIYDLDGDGIVEEGIVTVKHHRTLKTMAEIKYKDTYPVPGDNCFSYDIGPGFKIAVYDEVLSITNPGGIEFWYPGGPLG